MSSISQDDILNATVYWSGAGNASLDHSEAGINSFTRLIALDQSQPRDFLNFGAFASSQDWGFVDERSERLSRKIIGKPPQRDPSPPASGRRPVPALPTEILEQIFENCFPYRPFPDDKDTRLCLMLVCRDWYRIFQAHSDLWTSECFDEGIDAERISMFLERTTENRSVRIAIVDDVPILDISPRSVQALASRLESLSLFDPEEPQNFLDALANCTPPFGVLRDLFISCDLYTPAVAFAFNRPLPALQVLELHHVYLLADFAAPNLRVLKLSAFQMRTNALRMICAGLPSLEELEIWSSDLILPWKDVPTDSDSESISESEWVYSIPTLQALRIQNVSKHQMEGLMGQIECPNLQTLVISTKEDEADRLLNPLRQASFRNITLNESLLVASICFRISRTPELRTLDMRLGSSTLQRILELLGHEHEDHPILSKLDTLAWLITSCTSESSDYIVHRQVASSLVDLTCRVLRRLPVTRLTLPECAAISGSTVPQIARLQHELMGRVLNVDSAQCHRHHSEGPGGHREG